MRFAGFIGPSYQARSINIDNQRCINFYPELDEMQTGKEHEVASLAPTPGLNLLVTCGTGPIRGQWFTSKGRHFVASGAQLFEISSNFVATAVGSLTTSTGFVSMSDNGLQLFAVDGPSGYTFDFTTNVFAQVVDPAFPGANSVTYLDGSFIFNIPGTGQFGWTGLNQVTFSGANIASSEGNPDNIVGVTVCNRNLWLFNDQTTEVFYDNGDVNLPYQRIQGAFAEMGCVAPGSISKLNNTIFWLGKDSKGFGMVFMANGYQPQRVSTHAVEIAIQGYTTITDATSYSYQATGHSFFVLNFPTANTTWTYDISTSLWHERCYFNQGFIERHRADNHAFAFGKHVVGDYANGNLYELTDLATTDNGAPILRRRTAPHLSTDMTRNFFDSFQLDMEAGVGLDGLGQGTDPQVMLRFSDDGGHTWSNEKWTSIGKIGQTKARAIWRRLGSARDRVFEISITDPVRISLIGADVEIQQGRY